MALESAGQKKAAGSPEDARARGPLSGWKGGSPQRRGVPLSSARLPSDRKSPKESIPILRAERRTDFCVRSRGPYAQYS